MDPSLPYPLDVDSDFLVRHCKLPPHVGVGRVAQHGPSASEFNATFLHPATGPALILLRGPAEAGLNRNFGEGLTVAGRSADGPFELRCPRYYVRSASERGDDPSWAIACPVNEHVTIRYGEDRPIARVQALINNFDFECGNVRPDPEAPRGREVLRVEAGGRVVEFAWRENHAHLRRLVECEVLRTTALTSFTFDAWVGASEADLGDFAYNVASLCTIAAKQFTGVPVLAFLDAEGRPTKRVVGDALESPFRSRGVFRFPHLKGALPRLFKECFDEHVRLKGNDLWNRLPLHCAAVEDSPYLEQRVASLMAAVEALIRGALQEGKHCTPEQAEGMTLSKLVGAARCHLGWDFPKHYTRQARHLDLRNAVAHGNELPFSAEAVRHDFDKWYLFLLRRLLMRMGFGGEVASPDQGWASSSPVNDFTEDRNSFGG